MALTNQEKLALALTSFGSQRAMAEALGVHRRTLGRWLKEGEAEGVKAIPAHAEEAIRTAFEIHRDLVVEQAKADKIPYNYYRPIFLERKMLRTGQPGDRVVGENTQYIRRDLRMQVMADQQRSRKYISASVRSVIDLHRYFRLDAEGNLKQQFLRGKTPAARASESLNNFVKREKRERGRIVVKSDPFPLYTRYENISPQRDADDMRGVIGIEKQMRSKHEPATGEPGTVAADQYLFQLMPEKYAAQYEAKRSKQAGNKRRAKKATRK